MKSAYCVNNPAKIFFYSNREPEGEWWHKIKNNVELVYSEPPVEIFGNKLYHPAHQSDVARIKILSEKGGIYLDLDILCKKSFEPLMKHKFVLGQQGKIRKMGLCNGVILAEKNARFLELWLDRFKNFRSKGYDKYWDEMSIKMSYKLSTVYPDLIHVEPYDSFHFPLYYPWGLKNLFVKNRDYKNAYCHHFWEGGAWDKYLKNLTVNDIKTRNTTFNVIARKYLD